MELKTTFKFYVADGGFVGAYKTGSLNAGEPLLYFNMDFHAQVLNDLPKEERLHEFKDGMLQTLTHEFCHAMQEWLGKEYDELEVEKILGAYNNQWNAFEAEPENENDGIEHSSFKIADFLHWMNGTKAQTLDEFKAEVNEIFKPIRLWIEAEDKHKADKQNA